MSDAIILHHYDTSPFSEKIRVLFGLKGMAWTSVHVPNMMPKPDLVELTGGYARTPVLQIDAEIYCDTAAILDALEARGELDNSIIAITSDNGASAEGAYHGTHNETLFMNGHYPSAEENMPFLDKWGGPETQPHYSFGWAVAGNTPFRYFKQTTHVSFGCIRA